MEILRQYRVTFDYSRKHMIVEEYEKGVSPFNGVKPN
jgi:hypothetical protein